MTKRCAPLQYAEAEQRRHGAKQASEQRLPAKNALYKNEVIPVFEAPKYSTSGHLQYTIHSRRYLQKSGAGSDLSLLFPHTRTPALQGAPDSSPGHPLLPMIQPRLCTIVHTSKKVSEFRAHSYTPIHQPGPPDYQTILTARIIRYLLSSGSADSTKIFLNFLFVFVTHHARGEARGDCGYTCYGYIYALYHEKVGPGLAY